MNHENILQTLEQLTKSIVEYTQTQPAKKTLKGVYAGSFDPITIGHVAIVKESMKIVDELVIAVGDNPEKKYCFSGEERTKLITDCFAQWSNITVRTFDNMFLVDFAKSVGADFIIKGLRNATDFEHELVQDRINRRLSDIQTIYLIAESKYTEISSSLVKNLIGPDGWEKAISGLIPDNVLNEFILRKDEKPKPREAQ